MRGPKPRGEGVVLVRRRTSETAWPIPNKARAKASAPAVYRRLVMMPRGTTTNTASHARHW